MIEKKLKFPLFYLANEEILQKIEQENSKCICYFEFSLSGFPHLHVPMFLLHYFSNFWVIMIFNSPKGFGEF